jgi:hypothetical protein
MQHFSIYLRNKIGLNLEFMTSDGISDGNNGALLELALAGYS